MSTKVPSKSREEGVGTTTGPDKNWVDTPPVTSGQLSAKFRASLAEWRKHMVSNAQFYANLRQGAGLPSKPRYIISDFGLVSNNGYDRRRFTWTYIPPMAAAVKVWPSGKLRPWTFVVMHAFGHGVDMGAMWRGGEKNYKGNTQLLYVSKDKYGHSNKRWMAGVRELTRSAGLSPGQRLVSIHFCVSRRGDVIVSADLNDEARHAGGELIGNRPALGFSSNNAVSIGIELEVEFIRTKPGGATYLSPYTKPQMIALAIVLKKVETFRPIKHKYITKRVDGSADDLGKTQRLAQRYLSGYTQHNDFNPQSTRSDAGAQFNIPPEVGRAEFGSDLWRGARTNNLGTDPNNGFAWKDPRTGITHHKVKSGWTELWYYMRKVRKFNLATQVFAAKIPPLEIALLADLSISLQLANNGQKTLLRSHQKKIWSLRRAITMEQQQRAVMYGQAMSRGTGLMGALQWFSSNISRLVNRFDTSNLVEPIGPLQSYHEGSGTWYEGGQDTGSA